MSDNARSVLDSAIIGATIAVVVALVWAFAWAKVQNEPRFASGITQGGQRWCQTYVPDTHPCPAYRVTVDEAR